MIIGRILRRLPAPGAVAAHFLDARHRVGAPSSSGSSASVAVAPVLTCVNDAGRAGQSDHVVVYPSAVDHDCQAGHVIKGVVNAIGAFGSDQRPTIRARPSTRTGPLTSSPRAPARGPGRESRMFTS